MTTPTAEQIEHFLHEQIACWNRGDRDGFFGAYRGIVTGALQIEYVGKHRGDGWTILENMWDQNQQNIAIEELELIVNGAEAACHNRNNIQGTAMAIETIEIYKFADNGDLEIRYFIKEP
ncbi:nuclear transport factor 2 family protein [Gammaproteobacteria bacterium LSUCC0057]|uniref:Nuclear transport factor 2 family protein n=1 Tax=Gammaproteobacteria bacterium LSUCC0057 TaxID=2559237 RepID=A0A4Y8UH61_9GAMM|nr:nuclear transport factor 2 family protein [Gammaproteobacteria bacterium LSUCC0057]